MSDSRIIKFRAWELAHKRWVTHSITLTAEGSIIQMFLDDKGGFHSFRKNSEDYIIQEFTGLLDKNGKEIYEADLVNFTIPGITHGPEREDFTCQEVHWAEEDGCWAFGRWGNNYAPGEIYYSIPGDRIQFNSFEIVGNIFENPELVTTV